MLNDIRVLLVICACVAVSITALSCGGKGSNCGQLAAPPVAPADVGALGWPAFPGMDPIADESRVAAADNYQYGRDAVFRSPQGTEVFGDDLELTGSPGQAAWGSWRWGRFADGVLPQTLAIEMIVPGESEYWVLLPDFGTSRWEILGPMSDKLFSHTYEPAVNRVSPGGYSSVVVLVEGSNEVAVERLNLVATKDVTPPAAPRDLDFYPPNPTSVMLFWTKNTEPDLYRYKVYMGPQWDFSLSDEGVQCLGQVAPFSFEYSASGLASEQTYYFRVTALDVAQNESLPSNTATVTTPADVPLPRPTNLKVDAVGSSWADLSWQVAYDPRLQGFNVYTGPTEGFAPGEEGVVKRNPKLIEEPSYRVTDLESDTFYYVAVQAYYLGGQSALSDKASFSTPDSTPPEPHFTYDPAYVQVGLPVTFDPTGTTDVDTPGDELIFKWDFDNDDDVDESTTGPELVTHIYRSRGPVTAKLTVTDGTHVSTTEDITVNMRYRYYEAAQASGAPGEVVAIDGNPTSSELCVLLSAGEETAVKYYNGAVWQQLDVGSIQADHFSDVALDGNAVSLLVVDLQGADIVWTVYAYDGTWLNVASEQTTADVFGRGKLDVSAAGRLAVALVTGTIVGDNVSYDLEVWHEKLDGTFSADSAQVSTNVIPPVDVQRNDANSYIIFCQAGQIRQWSFDELTDTDTAMQTLTGVPLYLASGYDPDASGRVYWASATDTQRIYYGDNYGAANGTDQYCDVAKNVTGLLGVGLVGDNEAIICWTDEDSTDIQRLMTVDTAANGGSGETYEILTGIGAADGGDGAYFGEDSALGLFAVCTETRDGECIGRFIVEGSVESTDVIYAPQGDADILGKHQSVMLTNGSVVCLSQQPFATARASLKVVLGADPTYYNVGTNGWCVPDTAAPTRFAGEFLVGGYSENGTLVINKFMANNPPAQQSGVFTGTALARLAYNPYSETTLLCTAVAAGETLEVRTWHEVAWSTPTEVYSGTEAIEVLRVVGTLAGGWGIAFVDAADNLWLVESAGLTWGDAVLLSSEPVDTAAGLGFDYHSSGGVCALVERDGADPGLFLGELSPGESMSWELVADTSGSEVTNLAASYHLDSPLIFYYRAELPVTDSRVHVVERIGGAWETTALPGQLHGSPIGFGRTGIGDVVLTGYRIDAGWQRAAIGVFYR